MPQPEPVRGPWRPGNDQHDASSVVVDCDSCVVRGPAACGDCVVTVLLGGPPPGVEVEPVRFDADEHAALDVLADVGVVPPLRMVSPVTFTPEIPPVTGDDPA